MNSLSYIETIVNGLVHFVENETLPGLMQTVGMAYLTVLVPIAVAILIYLVQEKDGNTGHYASLNLHTVLDRIIRFKLLLISIGFIFIPVLFWSVSSSLWRLVILILWVIALIFLIKTLINVYQWVKGNRQEYRLEYLNSKLKPDDLIESFSSIWSVDGNDATEREYFIIFTSKIDNLLNGGTKDIELAQKLLEEFSSTLEKRSSRFMIIFPEVLPVILGWHYSVWENEYKYLVQDNENTKRLWQAYTELSDVLFDTINRALKFNINNRFAVHFFNTLEKHTELHKNDYISNLENETDYVYIEQLLRDLSVVKKIAETDNINRILTNYFPKNWKITEDNIQEDKAARIMTNEYLNWLVEGINDPENEWDKKLEDINRYLLPEADPITWGILTTFALRAYSESRVAQYIKSGRKFGLMGHVHGFWAANDERTLNERFVKSERGVEQNAMSLARQLFSGIYNKEKIQEYLSELTEHNQLNEEEQKNKEELENNFKEFLKYLEQVEGSKE